MAAKLVTIARHAIRVAVVAALLGCGEGRGKPQFLDIGTDLPGVCDGSLAWGDYDNDGDLDLALAGYYWDGRERRVSKIFRNDEAGAFTDIGAGLTGVSFCSLAWGDYDGDGDLDLALAGYHWDGTDNFVSQIYRNDGGTFRNIGAGLTGVNLCSLAWGDYDNDGDLDLALAGHYWAGTHNRVSQVYRNDSGTFTDIGAGLRSVSSCCLAWGDYDNDGDLDLALAGYDDVTPHVGKIYENNAGTFADLGAGLMGVWRCSLAWGDYDSDGDLDLALQGATDTAVITAVYRNDGGTLNDTGAALVGVAYGALAWGDYDNDGDLDLALTGPAPLSKVYRNDGGTFVDTGAALTGVIHSSVAWGDYDNDSDIDIAMTGYDGSDEVCRIYRSDGGPFNWPPSAPAGLAAAFAGGEVTFSWDASTDPETPLAGLTYNLRVGTTPGGDEVFPGMASATGCRRLPARGVAQPGASTNEWTLALPAGTYYWSVQAIDTAFAGSPWAPEETVVVP